MHRMILLSPRLTRGQVDRHSEDGKYDDQQQQTNRRTGEQVSFTRHATAVTRSGLQPAIDCLYLTYVMAARFPDWPVSSPMRSGLLLSGEHRAFEGRPSS